MTLNNEKYVNNVDNIYNMWIQMPLMTKSLIYFTGCYSKWNEDIRSKGHPIWCPLIMTKIWLQNPETMCIVS